MKVTFLSSRGRGITPDLSLLQKYICNHLEDVESQYFIRKELTRNTRHNNIVKTFKKEAYPGMGHVVCPDMSLDYPLADSLQDRRRILVGAAYEYFFRAGYLLSAGQPVPEIKSFAAFSHVIAGSPFVESMLARSCDLSDTAVLTGVCTPYAADICDSEKRRESRTNLSVIYPFLQDKKVMAFITRGKKQGRDYDLKRVVSEYGGDWCIITNEKGMVESLRGLEHHGRLPVIYAGEYLPDYRLLYLADVLITNNGYYASAYAAARKPVYALSCNECWFEKYMKALYPALFLERVDDMLSGTHDAEEGGIFHDFWDSFSYPADSSPGDHVVKLLEQAPGGYQGAMH